MVLFRPGETQMYYLYSADKPETYWVHFTGSDVGLLLNYYDNNMILSPTSYKLFDEQKLGLVAIAENDKLSMNVYTDQPGMQLYIGYFLGKGPDFKGGIPQIQYGGFFLETQTEPNCVKHGEGIYHSGEKYRHYTVYEFHKK